MMTLNTTIASMHVLVISLFFLGLIAGIVALQIFLSRREGKWQGLILPIISFVNSVMLTASVLLFSPATSTQVVMVNGEVIEETTRQIASTGSIIGMAAYIFMISNIPTAVLTLIYAACRGKREKQRALEKMSVQDLE